MKRFALGILVGVFGTAAAIAAAFAGLVVFAPENLPPPAISRILALDLKLRLLRARHDIDPVVLGAGSSIAWRQLSGATIERFVGRDVSFFNGATAYVNIHQTAALIEKFYLRNFKNVRAIVLLTNLPDFDDCGSEPADVLDPEDAERYAFEGWPAAFFYVRYFSPGRYVRSARTLNARTDEDNGDLFIDEYGTTSVRLSPERVKKIGLRYSEIRVDPTCTVAMLKFSKAMTARGIHLTVVFSPINPRYRARYPKSMDAVHELIAELRTKMADDNTRLIVLNEHRSFTVADFYDAFHLQAPAVPRLSRSIATTIKSDISEISVPETVASPGIAPASAGSSEKVEGGPDAKAGAEAETAR